MFWIAILSIYFSTSYFRASDNLYTITTGKETEICDYNDFSPFTFTFSKTSEESGSPRAQMPEVYPWQIVLVWPWIYSDGSFLKDCCRPNYPTTKSKWTSYCTQSQWATFKVGKMVHGCNGDYNVWWDNNMTWEVLDSWWGFEPCSWHARSLHQICKSDIN